MNDTHESIENADDGRKELQIRCERLEKENDALRARLELAEARHREGNLPEDMGVRDAERVIGFARALSRSPIPSPEVPSIAKEYVSSMPKDTQCCCGAQDAKRVFGYEIVPSLMAGVYARKGESDAGNVSIEAYESLKREAENYRLERGKLIRRVESLEAMLSDSDAEKIKRVLMRVY